MNVTKAPQARTSPDAPGPLALVGGEEFQEGNEPHDSILAKAALGSDGAAFVLATAAARHDPAAVVGVATRWFAGLGLAVQELPVLTRTQASSEDLALRARTGRFFYLAGGDPGQVVRVLRGSRVWEAVEGAWRGGAALGGSSAGAMAMGEWSYVRQGAGDRRKRRYMEALGLVPRVTLLPHFRTFGATWVDSALKVAPRARTLLLGIDERTAVVWQEGHWRVTGTGSATLIRGLEDRVLFLAGQEVEELPAPGSANPSTTRSGPALSGRSAPPPAARRRRSPGTARWRSDRTTRGGR